MLIRISLPHNKGGRRRRELKGASAQTLVDFNSWRLPDIGRAGERKKVLSPGWRCSRAEEEGREDGGNWSGGGALGDISHQILLPIEDSRYI
jgi:hypothetical protein